MLPSNILSKIAAFFKQEYETLVKAFEKKILTTFCNEKVQIVNQILREGFNQLMKSKISQNKQVSDYLMNILLELVIIHSAFSFSAPATLMDFNLLGETLLDHFPSPCQSREFRYTIKQLSYHFSSTPFYFLCNYLILIFLLQVMVDLQFFLQICQNYENKEIQNITSNSMGTFNLVFDHLSKLFVLFYPFPNVNWNQTEKPIRDEQPLIANILATTIKKTKKTCFFVSLNSKEINKPKLVDHYETNRLLYLPTLSLNP